MLRILKITIILALAFAFSACNLRPRIPAVDTNVSIQNAITNYNINDKWWEEFENQELNDLIQSALSRNNDLLLAQNYMEQARVMMNLAKIDFLPNSALQGDATRTRSSSMLQNKAPSMTYSLYSVAAAASWEIDLWGRVRNAARAGIASFEASEADYANARLSVIANVANTYFALIALNEQEQILKDSLASYEETLKYRKAELESGAITELIYYQAQASVDSAKSQLATLQDSLIKTRTALAIMSGKDVQFIANNTIKISNPAFNVPEVPDGILADVLERRPDVMSALLRFKAANAQIGVARANYFPQLSLTGMFGFSSTDFNNLINSSAKTWQVGGSLIMPLLDFGRTYNQVELAWLDQNASMLEYDRTLKNALGEVHDALALRQNANTKLIAAQSLKISQNRVFELSKMRYDAGYSSHLEYLDAQRMLLSASLELASAKAGIANAVVEVYKALGGGFKSAKSLEKTLE